MGLFESLKEYEKRNTVRFHMPGHKGKDLGLGNIYGIDITEIPGFDDLHDATGLIFGLNKRLSGLYGAESAEILVNGSTVGILAGIFATVKEEEKVLIPRECHKSVYNSLMLRKAEPVFFAEDSSDTKLTVITYPTYKGDVFNIKDIIKTSHSRGSLVLADAAHSAHFGILPGFPVHPISMGVDIAVTSLHKTLPYLTQTSCILFGMGNENVAMEVRKYLSYFETSSPSYVMMAAADRALSFIEENAKALSEKLLNNISELERRCENLNFIEIENTRGSDPSKIVLRSDREEGSRIIFDELRKEGIEPEMYTHEYCLLMASIMNESEDFERLWGAIKRIDSILRGKKREERAFPKEYPIPERVLPMYQAVNRPSRLCDMEKAPGQICAGFIEMYPPGVPILIPGERIKKEHTDLVKKAKELNINIRGISGDKIPVI